MTFLENLENMITEGWATEAEVKAASELRRLYALNAEQQVVMKQALEALSEVDNCTYINDYGDAALDTAYESGMVDKAIAALREALHGSISPNARKT